MQVFLLILIIFNIFMYFSQFSFFLNVFSGTKHNLTRYIWFLKSKKERQREENALEH